MISIILPTHNNEKTIFFSIKSILQQSYSDFELIIINDFSSDKTKQIIQSFSDNRIVYLENEKNIGGTLSMIRGIKIAKGDFIARMDGDDIAVPERLDIQLKYLTENPNIDLVGSNIIFFIDNKVTGISDFKLYNIKSLSFYIHTVGLPQPTWMARSNFFTNFKYDLAFKNYVEDQDLLLRIYHTSRFKLLKEHLLFYRMPNRINVKFKLKQSYLLFISRVRHMRKNNLFFFFPIILFTYLATSIIYGLRLKSDRKKNTFNSKFQNILDKIIEGI